MKEQINTYTYIYNVYWYGWLSKIEKNVGLIYCMVTKTIIIWCLVGLNLLPNFLPSGTRMKFSLTSTIRWNCHYFSEFLPAPIVFPPPSHIALLSYRGCYLQPMRRQRAQIPKRNCKSHTAQSFVTDYVVSVTVLCRNSRSHAQRNGNNDNISRTPSHLSPYWHHCRRVSTGH